MVISQTPYRISFLGGGTDYRPYFMEYGGNVLSTTMDKYCYITVRDMPPFFTHRSKATYSKIEIFNEWDEVEHPSIRECLRYMNINSVSILHDGDLPARAGLGTSSTFTVGLLNALHAMKGEYVDPLLLATEAIHVEQDLIGENVGVQDQLAAAIGGLNRIYFSADGYYSRPVIMSPERKACFNDSLMLFFTGFVRFASEIAADQIKNTRNKTRELHHMCEMAEEGERILSGNGELTDFGRLLDEGWKIKRGLSHKITTDAIDEIYKRAMAAGAVGGKLLGAGGGGFILFFVEPDKQESVKAALSEFLYVPFRFSAYGSRILYARRHNDKVR